MEAVWDILESTSEFKDSDVVLLYWSLSDEVPTHEFINKWYKRKRIVLPKVSGDDLLLFEYDPDNMVRGTLGVLEPGPGSIEVNPSEIQLAIVPGRKFDLSGGRKGRGRGYYDRFLPKLHCTTIGVAFENQIEEHLDIQPHDFILDKIIY